VSDTYRSPVPLRTVVLVDFDNVFSALQALGPIVAERFAQDPVRWLDWLAAGSHAGEDAAPRRLLSRRCYINPDAFGRHRGSFVLAGFIARDCPPLTSRGKTGTDMWLAVDLLDLMAHPAGFEEFILLSGDTDFTPLLLRLREHDRRGVVIGANAGALRGAADLSLSIERFAAAALGFTEAPRSAARPPEAERAVVAEGDETAIGPTLAVVLDRIIAAGAPVPRLSTAAWRALYRALLQALRHGGQFDLLGRTRELCVAAGAEVPLRAIASLKERLPETLLREPPEDWPAVAEAHRDAVLAMCQRRNVVLVDAERALLDAWLLPAPEEEATEPASEATEE
jgi:hypothetical protein